MLPDKLSQQGWQIFITACKQEISAYKLLVKALIVIKSSDIR